MQDEDSEMRAGRAHCAAISAAFETGDASLFAAAIESLARRFHDRADVQAACAELRTEIDRVAGRAAA